MNRTAALAAIFLLWAAIYLPGLGRPELKGEEGRRILPGLAMLETGNWLVPYLNGEPYLRKPPMINWLIAGSVEVTGERSERAARLPSVLAVLALGLTLVWTGSRWLTPAGGFAAAVFTLTSVAFLEKGRLAEIEALYVSLTGIAFALWLAAWARRETGWRLWLLPAVALGLGMLTKGPGHLLLFYGVVIPVVIAAGGKRQLWSLPQLGSLALVFLIFAAWAVPYFRAAAEMGAGGVWASQAGNVAGGGSLKLSDWLPNFPRAFSNGLPWILFAALWWNRRVLAALQERDERMAQLVRVARWPIVIGFVGLMVFPGVLPRYTLPLLPAAALLLAAVVPFAAPGVLRFWWIVNRGLILLVLGAAAASPWIVRPAAFGTTWLDTGFLIAAGIALPLAALWILRRQSLELPSLVGGSSLCIAGAMAVYAVAILPRMALRDDLRPIAAQINTAVSSGETLHVITSGYEAFYFYLEMPCVFQKSPKKIADNAEQILFPEKALQKVKARWPEASDATRLKGPGKKEFFLLKLSPERGKNPRPNQE